VSLLTVTLREQVQHVSVHLIILSMAIVSSREQLLSTVFKKILIRELRKLYHFFFSFSRQDDSRKTSSLH
jgi:hypothetical protein